MGVRGAIATKRTRLCQCKRFVHVARAQTRTNPHEGSFGKMKMKSYCCYYYQYYHYHYHYHYY